MKIFKRQELDFVLPSEMELVPEERTTFKLKALGTKQFLELQDKLITVSPTAGVEGQGIKNFSAYMYQVAQYGLVGWANFLDENNAQVKFNVRDMEKNLELLPANVLMEIATKVLDMSILNSTEVKN